MPRQRRVFSRPTRLVFWLMFDVLFAFATIIVGLLIFIATGDGQDTGRIIIHGELALISVAIAANAIEESLRWLILKRTQVNVLVVAFAFAGCIVVSFFGGMWYVIVALGNVKFPTSVVIVSIIIVLVTLGASGVCIWNTTEA